MEIPNKTPQFFYAEVILPLSVEGTFTYSIPASLQLKIQLGMRVVVSFGGKKLYTAIVESLHNNKPELYKTKDIVSLLEDFPLVTHHQLLFWKWIATYYLSTLGEVYKNAIPTALKLQSETFIKKNDQANINFELLDEYETLIFQSLEVKSSISLKELEAFIPQAKIISTLKTLFDEGFILIDEKLIEKYTPKKVSFIRLHPSLKKNEIKLQTAIQNLEKAQKQRELLLKFFYFENLRKGAVEKSEFLKKNGFTSATLNALREKNILEIYFKTQDRIAKYKEDIEDLPILSDAQKNAYTQILNSWQTKSVALLKGITASGKTEVYMQCIQQFIDKGKTILLLLPEISVVTQLVVRIQKKFGDGVGVYHSKMNQQERVEIYNKTLKGQYKIIIGVRSSVFLPFHNLGLIIVDESHEYAYKQNDIKPYFNAKDATLYLAKLHQAKVLLSSATPSLETIQNINEDKIGKIELNERYGKVLPPKIELIDLNKEIQTTGVISIPLENKIKEVLDSGKQVIVFQNRRGYSPVVECVNCSYSPDCPNCDIKLNYHKHTQNIKCHYCGYQQNIPKTCPSCQSENLDFKGLGIQKLEDELKEKFVNANVFRMDSDTMRKKHAYEKLFEEFEDKKIDILLGTQMLTKGLDFSSVQLVAIPKADALFNIPDFRIQERVYQLLNQVAGRAGRRKTQGEVYIQTHNPNEMVYQALIHNTAEKLYQNLLEERKSFLYPPFTKLIQINFKHSNKEKAEKVALYFTHFLQSFIPNPYILGPEAPSIARVNNMYRYQTLIKIPKSISASKIKEKIKEVNQNLQKIKGLNNVRVQIDVDPL